MSRSLADVKEKEVPVSPDRLGGENGGLYFPEEAVELTDLAWLREDTGLLVSTRCLSIPFGSKGVRRLPYALLDSRISGGSCKVRWDLPRDRASSIGLEAIPRGRCWTLATIAGLSRSYC